MRRTTVDIAMVATMGVTLMGGCRTTGAERHRSIAPRHSERPAAAEVVQRIRAGEWVGHAISYSGYREGQHPGTGVYPSRAEILEDLRILEAHWSLIRVYGSGPYEEEVLDVIRRERVGLKVMLGIWLGKEPGQEAANAEQVARGIRLANEYADLIFAVNVGNEALVHWTAHPVPEDRVIEYVRRVRAGVSVPVTVADNFAWWVSDGERLAREVDFITMHSYPVWERKPIEQGLAYTIENYEAVRAAFPEKPIVIGEAGWPSYTEGNLHVHQAGTEESQQRYYKELTAWAQEQGVTVFFFEAFDEPWKGTGTEGHWGFFSVDRKAKRVMRERFPKLTTELPTSPAYGDAPDAPGSIPVAAAFRESLALRLEHGTVNFHGTGVDAERCGESTRPADGFRRMNVAFNGRDWGGVYLLFDQLDAGAARTVAMSLEIPANVTELELKLEGPATNAQSVNLMDYIVQRGPDGWSMAAVPVTALNRIDFARLAVVGLWNPKDASGAYVAGDLQIGDLHLE